jgi:hypothetical protein
LRLASIWCGISEQSGTKPTTLADVANVGSYAFSCDVWPFRDQMDSVFPVPNYKESIVP